MYFLCLCLCVFVLLEVQLGLFGLLSFVGTVTLVRLAYHRLLASRGPSLWHVVCLGVCTNGLGLSVCCIHQDHAACSDVALHGCLFMMLLHCIKWHHCQTCQSRSWLSCLVYFVAGAVAGCRQFVFRQCSTTISDRDDEMLALWCVACMWCRHLVTQDRLRALFFPFLFSFSSLPCFFHIGFLWVVV